MNTIQQLRNTKWIIDKPLNIKEREVLMIILESLNVPIYMPTREARLMDEYPYIGLCNNLVMGFGRLIDFSKYNNYVIISYERMIEILRNILKQENNDNKSDSDLVQRMV